MTSEAPFISKLIDKYRQSLLEHSVPNGILSNRLLSPIIENSAEILSGSDPINRVSLDASLKATNIVLTNENSTIDEFNQLMIQRLNEYFHHIKNYIEKINVHFAELSIIIEALRRKQNFNSTIELIETRLLKMRVKRNQISHLLNQSFIKDNLEQVSLHKEKLQIDSYSLLIHFFSFRFHGIFRNRN